ncbi:MAG: histidine--tRNA ligase [Candidatus Diapherotrites archaeon]|nr:histidine--tRNA ligase [Candidatus Diapherotrites archaeon]
MDFTKRVRGTRDFLPPLSVKRAEFLRIIEDTYREFGFIPWDTPALEMAELLTSKGGEEIRDELYLFKDKAGREIGLRFDLTLPTARVLAENKTLPLPIKRYMIGKVWRYDRPQAGRFREFTQADVDIFGTANPLADAEVIAAPWTALRRAGLEGTVQLNDRRLLDAIADYIGLPAERRAEFYRAIDKWYKIGEDGVREELKDLAPFLDRFLEFNVDLSELPERSDEIRTAKDGLLKLGEYLDDFGVLWTFNLFIVRGLDYYTGPIFETFADRPTSILSGGRYDELIGLLGGKSIPATGGSIGVDRVLDLYVDSMNLSAKEADIYVAIIPGYEKKGIRIARELRGAGKSIFMDVTGRKLGKQLADAERRGIRTVVIVGRETENGKIVVKDMETGEQRTVDIADLSRAI